MPVYVHRLHDVSKVNNPYLLLMGPCPRHLSLVGLSDKIILSKDNKLISNLKHLPYALHMEKIESLDNFSKTALYAKDNVKIENQIVLIQLKKIPSEKEGIDVMPYLGDLSKDYECVSFLTVSELIEKRETLFDVKREQKEEVKQDFESIIRNIF